MQHTSSAKTYFIIHGFAEGPWHSRGIEASLREAGLHPAKRQQDAELVITHSGGCLLTDRGNAIYINPTVWPEKTFLQKFWTKLVRDFRDVPLNIFFKKLLWNVIYLSRVHHNLRQLWPYLKINRSEFRSARSICILRDSMDAWCSPDIKEYFPRARIINIIGTHDSCWTRSQAYVDAILETQ